MSDGYDRGRERGFTDEELIIAIARHNPTGTQELASEMGVSRRTVEIHCKRLSENGIIRQKKIGNVLVWYL